MEQIITQEDIFLADRCLHHKLALKAYEQSFTYKQLSEKYRITALKRLMDVFNFVQIADPKFPSIKRGVDTFDLINPLIAHSVVDGCYRDLPNQSRAISCLKVINLYCQFLKSSPVIQSSGQKPLHIPSIYGPIESPVGPYAIPVNAASKGDNHRYLTASEYKQWLRFLWQLTVNAKTEQEKRFANQQYVMCVIAGELGLRIQEILGLERRYINLVDSECLVTWGKASNGSGFRKRLVPITPSANQVIKEFLNEYPRQPDEPLFQNRLGKRLSKSTAHSMMNRLKEKIKEAGLPIYIDKGFGWHAFRRTFTRCYLEKGGNIFDLKRATGWSYTSTISHYLGDEKPQLRQEKGFVYQPQRKDLGGFND